MRKRHTFYLAMAFLFGNQALWSTPSLATDYYADINRGNNTYSGLTPDEAFSDLKHAMKQLHAGDTLHVRSGEYRDIVYLRSAGDYKSGTSTQPITVKAYQNEAPVIGKDALLVIEDLSWWVFEGLIFQNSGPLRFGMRDTTLVPVTNQCTSTAENITVRENRFQHGGSPGIRVVCGRHFKIQANLFDNLRSRIEGKDTQAIMLFYQASDVFISGNHFTDIGADGVHLLDNPGAAFTDIVITGNEFEIQRPYRYRDETGSVAAEDQQPFSYVGENAIDVKQGPGPVFISKNIIHGFRSTTAGQDASGSIGAGIVVHKQARNVTISRNIFHDNRIHLNVGMGSNTAPQQDRDTLIHNNIFDELADPNTTGDETPIGLSIGDVRNVRVFNNTFRSQYGDKVDLISFGYIGSVDLFNNAFYNGNIAINDANRNNLVADHNAWAQVTTNTPTHEVYPDIIGAHDIITDSLYIDPDTWEPLESSPLIDTGSSIEFITSDFYDAPISGLGHDIGAVEYISDTDIDPQALAIGETDIESQSFGGEASSSGSGGCSIYTGTRMDPVWLLILLVSSAGYARIRLR